jgi:quinol monooxygenase YgiN
MNVRWSIPPGESRALVSVLQGLMAQARNEPGCIGCSLATEMGAHVVVDYVEQWQDEATLETQLRSPRFAMLAELMEQASQHPTVTFVLPGSTCGLDYARAARDLKH